MSYDDAIAELEERIKQQAAVIEQMRSKIVHAKELAQALDSCGTVCDSPKAVWLQGEAIEVTCTEALALQPCPEVLNKVRADAVAKFAKYADDYEVDRLAAVYIQRIKKGEA